MNRLLILLLSTLSVSGATYTTCLHRLASFTNPIADLLTPSCDASSRAITPRALCFRIQRTCSSVSLANQCFSPDGNRPFRTISLELSPLVPRKRCAGLTQGGLSHLCNTQTSFGIGPCANIQLTLWANTQCVFHSALIWPYPPCFLHPIQSQQDSVLLTLLQNRYWNRSFSNEAERVSSVFRGIRDRCVDPA